MCGVTVERCFWLSTTVLSWSLGMLRSGVVTGSINNNPNPGRWEYVLIEANCKLARERERKKERTDRSARRSGSLLAVQTEMNNTGRFFNASQYLWMTTTNLSLWNWMVYLFIYIMWIYYSTKLLDRFAWSFCKMSGFSGHCL